MTVSHLEAVRSSLSPLPVFEYGRVAGLSRDGGGDMNPGVTPDGFVLLQVERVQVPNGVLVRQSRRTLWRLSLRAVGRSPAKCRDVLAAVAALEGVRLTVGGVSSTPLQHDSTGSPAPDDGWHSGLVRLTYSL